MALTQLEVVNLAKLIGALDARSNVKASWLDDEGDLRDGVVRCFHRDYGGGGFPTGDDDLRDCWLHLSGVVETWLPVRSVLDRMAGGEFALGA